MGFAALVLAALAACSSNAPAPVEDRYGGAAGQPTYQVQRGDTLYSIAFRYGLDYRRVAAANNIFPPYTIYPGQVILVRETASPGAPPAAVAPGAAVVTPYPAAAAPARPPQPLPQSGPGAPVVPDVPPIGATAPPPGIDPVPAAATPPPGAPSLPPAAAAPPPAAAVAAVNEPFTGAPVAAWRWPTAGRVTRTYSGTVHKGIDIDGRRGDPVHAAATGKVVYAGTGIVGFGELLIVKHNDTHLSAYGHNDRLLVTEGQIVQAGQQIAEKGSSGTDTVKLHFEIRQEGKPIDPLRLLPRR